MNPIRTFFKRLTTNPQASANYVGQTSFRIKNPYVLDCYAEDRYASIYPSIKAISNEFMKIRPKAIGSNGEPKSNAVALDALYHPNQLDSSVGFFEKLAVMNLTHRMTYLLVWRRQGNEAVPVGDLNPNNIAGYTFLENPAITRVDGKTFYNMGSQQFSEDEVIAIPGGVDPSGLYLGYAPGIASSRWATLDEYIADFQRGFFENGAVPAGQFVITSASKQDFDDTVDKLQDAHRGAGRNNNVTYTPRPVDPNSGKPADAKIEWIPYQQSNKDIDFKNLFEQANKRLDSTFGVPASIRGVGEANNYATARVDQQNFIRFTIEPLALRIYTQITHELNRITGGLGYAITFDLEYPAVADEEKVQAETKNIEVTAIRQLLDLGYTLDSAVDALRLSNAYKLLAMGETNETEIDNDKPDVDEGGEVEDAPNPEKIDGVTPLNVNNQLLDSEVTGFEDDLEFVIREHMSKQIEKYITDEVKNQAGDPTEDETEEFVNAMMVVLLSVMLASGIDAQPEGIALLISAGLDTGAITEYAVSEAQEKAYRTYLTKVGESYGSDTAKSIRKILDNSNTQGWTADQTKAELRNIMQTDEWRVKRLANTEVNLSQSIGSLDSMKQIQDESGNQINKIWTHTGGDTPCQFCQTMIGQKLPLDDNFVSFGSTVVGTDGALFVNDWRNIESGGLHANCHCLETYEVA